MHDGRARNLEEAILGMEEKHRRPKNVL